MKLPLAICFEQKGAKNAKKNTRAWAVDSSDRICVRLSGAKTLRESVI
jgi:hypothetical protein